MAILFLFGLVQNTEEMYILSSGRASLTSVRIRAWFLTVPQAMLGNLPSIGQLKRQVIMKNRKTYP